MSLVETGALPDAGGRRQRLCHISRTFCLKILRDRPCSRHGWSSEECFGERGESIMLGALRLCDIQACNSSS